MKIFLLLIFPMIMLGCVSNQTPIFQQYIENTHLDKFYTVVSRAESYNSGGHFVTTINFQVRDDEIISGTINKYSKTQSGVSNESFTLEEYKNNEYWRYEFHMQREIHDQIVNLTPQKSFGIETSRCFVLNNRDQSNDTVSVIVMDVAVCFTDGSISNYLQKSDYGRGGYYDWYKEGFGHIQNKMKEVSGL